MWDTVAHCWSVLWRSGVHLVEIGTSAFTYLCMDLHIRALESVATRDGGPHTHDLTNRVCALDHSYQHRRPLRSPPRRPLWR